jgi:RNA polymerase sigma factor (TIGR02999 family)
MGDDPSSSSGDITRLLRRAASGDDQAFEGVVSRVYEELESVAAARMRRNFGRDLAGVTLEPAALVNETLLKLIEHPRTFENRRHFYAYATKVMLRVLIDYQRRREAEKRGGDRVRVTVSALSSSREPAVTGAVELAEVLDRLAALDERKAEVVKLRVFWGLEIKEIAATLGTASTTIDRDWRFARRWLAWELKR